jgi:sarcosine oxidase subunit alpha
MPEPQRVQVLINGNALLVDAGITVAAALAIAGVPARRSRLGQQRGALCGMGICHECRANIDGVAHQRTCQVACSDGMWIRTDA